jgi:hypothetical protein
MTIPLATALQAARVYDLEQQRFHGMPIHRAHPAGYFYGLQSRHRDTYRGDQPAQPGSLIARCRVRCDGQVSAQPLTGRVDNSSGGTRL